MPIGSDKLTRYGEIARVLVRNRETVKLASRDDPELYDDSEMQKHGDQLAADLEALGPTFVKLGQVLSTRSDLLPGPYLSALSRLQDNVCPFPTEEARQIFEEELGVSTTDAFADFDEVPLASASLGQVHAATLRDGRAVVVKVQRPGIDRQVARDLDALQHIARALDTHTDAGRRFGFQDLLEQFALSLADEIDYRHEEQNLLRLREILADDEIRVPAPISDFSSRRVLTMEHIQGRKVTDLSRLAPLEMDGSKLADALIQAYLSQIFVHGFFHADPHPGNVVLTDDGHLALLDLGMVGYIRMDVRTQLVKLVLSTADGDGQEAGEALIRLGTPLEDFDEDRLLREASDLIARRHGMDLVEMQAGNVLARLSAICGSCGLRPPPELSLLTRAILNLESVTAALDPGFSLANALRRHANEVVGTHMESLHGALSALVEVKDFVEKLPRRANKILDAVAQGEFTLQVRAFDETEMLHSLTKIANRLAIGIVAAALFLGAALVSKAHPAWALGCFVVGAVLGVGLVASMVVVDRDMKRRRKRMRQM